MVFVLSLFLCTLLNLFPLNISMPTNKITIDEETKCTRHISRVTTAKVILNVNESIKHDNKQNHAKL